MTRRNVALIAMVAAAFALEIAAWGGIYMAAILSEARARGIYPTAEEGMQSLVSRGYLPPREIQIVYAGPNSFQGRSPHVWYVIACVWAERYSDGSDVGGGKRGYDAPGSFFLQTRDGWVHVPEGRFPEFVGFWMKVYGISGPGAPASVDNWGNGSECVQAAA